MHSWPVRSLWQASKEENHAWPLVALDCKVIIGV